MELYGVNGLQNLGNTCFFNAIIQCLIGTKKLSAYFFVSNDFKEKIKSKIYNIPKSCNITSDMILKKTFSYKFYEFISIYLSSFKKVLNPKIIHEIITSKYTEFQGFRQCDSHELLNAILNEIHNELMIKINIKVPKELEIEYEIIRRMGIRKDDFGERMEKFLTYEKINELKYYMFLKDEVFSNYSIITKLMMGIFKSEIICSNCNHKNTIFEKFTSIQLALPEETNENLSIYNCFDKFTEIEEIDYNCSCCKTKTKALKKIIIHELPHYLIIHFKRFIASCGCLTKNSIEIDSPIVISTEKISSKIKSYSLYGVVIHEGSLRGGHYTASTKNIINEEWYRYNDSNVSHIEKPLNLLDITNNGYILFYELI